MSGPPPGFLKNDVEISQSNGMGHHGVGDRH